MLTSTETEGRRSQIFYRMREFMGSREAILRLCLGAVGHGLLREKAAKFQSTCAKGSDTSATSVSRLLPAALEAPSWPAYRSLGGGSRLYSISERSVSRLPLLESSSSVSPAWSKHRRQSPLFTRNAVSHRGQSSGSCVIAGSESVEPWSIIGERQIVGAQGKSFIWLAPNWPRAHR